ncbi:hypothetical protein D5018_20145 [Parashewanella curva]|uniref:Uncharacterized protein n=1 Tax=Parashewanella curva TaxID=2338552 RepID=A0A3L8PR90_9GAMM|nr:hypothetical protein [Parashewanella curva]RLV57897.1 hypothetical protein D5018_20145 [Parashewanella curva]
MKFEEQFIVELQAIESSIVGVYRKNAETYDSQVERALSAVVKDLKAKQKNTTIQPNSSLSGNDFQLYSAITNACQTLSDSDPELSLEDLLNCCKAVKKSVKRWNKEYGRQGYITFISRFV